MTGYDLRGNAISQGGSQQYDVTYTFDAQGRMATMTTTGQAGNATTTWNYDSQRGFLTSKKYADGKGTDYTYTPAGRLATRTWARGSTTRYSYNAAGDLTLTDYSDTTPDVSMTYTRFGALESMSDATGTRTIRYNANLQPSAETFPAAFFGGRILTRSYDSLNRPTGFELGTVSAPAADHRVTYGYDAAGRLATVQDPSRTWTYSFVANSANLLSGVTSGNIAVAYTYETGRNAINSVENKVGTTTVSRFTYTNNALGQRTARSQSGSAFTAPATESFGYNAKGEVTDSSHSVDALRNTIYAYDGIGNRNEATIGGTTTAYTANALNQYSDLTPSNLPTFTPSYDFDGNMVSDGAGKRLVWDGENRLIEVRNAADDLMATYTYDGQSRRVKKVTTSLVPQGASEEVYLYDGWNRVASYSIQNSTFSIQNSHTWGRDLSGSLEGAGGVGGLLGVKDGATSYRVTYDANGNVSELIDGDGTIAAHYEYDPFGNVVVSTGSYAAANPWRFSTKPVEPETGYSYYGYRFYYPETGRWLNRDPIGEEGGENLYVFVSNVPISAVDFFGLQEINTKFEARDYYRSKKGGSTGAGQKLMNQIIKSKGFRDSKKDTVGNIISQLYDEVKDLCCRTSGTLNRSEGQVGFDAGNDIVGNITVYVSSYEVKWYRNSYSDKISLYSRRELSFRDWYAFVWDPEKPLKTVFTDVLPGLHAGEGTPFYITGEWTDKIDHDFTSWKCRMGKIF